MSPIRACLRAETSRAHTLARTRVLARRAHACKYRAFMSGRFTAAFKLDIYFTIFLTPYTRACTVFPARQYAPLICRGLKTKRFNRQNSVK